MTVPSWPQGDAPAQEEWEQLPVWVPPEIDTTIAHPARRYDYLLGGKDNFAADRQSGDAVMAAFPTARLAVQENRRFLGRAVEYLAGEVGIDQFLDIGTGLPATGNTHDVAQRRNPAARVVYVDNDPIVLVHARALLTSNHVRGKTTYIDADLRDPDRILADPALTATLDLSRPVGLMLVAVLHFLADADRPYEVVARLVEALPAGSYLVISHITADHLSAETHDKLKNIEKATTAPAGARTRGEIARFFTGHELVAPGIVSLGQWRADQEPQPRPSAADIGAYGAVARLHPGAGGHR